MVSAGFEYVGSGSNRSFSFTDLLLRQGNTNLAELTAANWGVIEVKGPWQLGLPDNVNLVDALNHPTYRKAVLSAVQQVLQVADSTRLLHSGMCCACSRSELGSCSVLDNSL